MEKTLKERREELGLSQVAMAVRCGVSLTSYRLWEYGVSPSDENRKKLEEVLHEAETRQAD